MLRVGRSLHLRSVQVPNRPRDVPDERRGAPGTATATVTVTVTATATNSPPKAVNDSAAVTKNSSNNVVPALANDSDPDGDPLSVVAVGTASHGTVRLSNGIVTYTPTNGYTGSDMFSYTIADGRGGRATASVSVSVVRR